MAEHRAHESHGAGPQPRRQFGRVAWSRATKGGEGYVVWEAVRRWNQSSQWRPAGTRRARILWNAPPANAGEAHIAREGFSPHAVESRPQDAALLGRDATLRQGVQEACSG